MSKNKMTIEDLASEMKTGFEKTNKRTDEKIEHLATLVQKGFEGVDKRFDGVENRLGKVETELRETREVLSRAIKDLESRFSSNFSYSQDQIDHLKNWMEGIETRIAALEVRGKK